MYVWCVRLGLLAAVVACATTLAADEPERVQIGVVLGQPVYRDQLGAVTGDQLEDTLHRVFLGPVAKRYRAEHADEVTPTAEEIHAAAEWFRQEHEARIAPDAAKWRAELAEIEARLREPALSDSDREELERRKTVLEAMLGPLPRQFAEFILGSWKFQRHLYETYGRGRVLWQQAGYEAFDATRNWLIEQESQGAFRITNPQMRAAFYAYWKTKDHGSFLFDNPKRIADEFLNPAWARGCTRQPTSKPTSGPMSPATSKPASQPKP